MKHLLLTVLASASALTAFADQKAGFASIEVRTQKGETTVVTLTDDLTTTFTATDVVFADANNSVALPLKDLRSYTFVPAVIPEGVTSPVVSADAQIFTIDGRRIDNLNAAPAGTYVVRHGETTFKVHHRK